MIIKNITRTAKSGRGGIRATLNYVFRYVLDKEKTGQTPDLAKHCIIAHNIRNRTDIKEVVKEFEAVGKRRVYTREDQTVLHHTIISFHPEDSKLVTDAMLRDIAKKYIQLRGHNTVVIGARHGDRSHAHIHLVMSGTRLNGRSSRISNKDFQQIKIAMDEYQKALYPELIHSLPPQTRILGENRIKNELYPNRSIRKERLAAIIYESYSQAQSTAAFLCHIEKKQISPYYRNGILTGIIENGIKYRLATLGYDRKTLDQLEHRKVFEQEMNKIQAIRANAKQRFLNRDFERDIPLSKNGNVVNGKEGFGDQSPTGVSPNLALSPEGDATLLIK
jgi:hypothetical protein